MRREEDKLSRKPMRVPSPPPSFLKYDKPVLVRQKSDKPLQRLEAMLKDSNTASEDKGPPDPIWRSFVLESTSSSSRRRDNKLSGRGIKKQTTSCPRFKKALLKNYNPFMMSPTSTDTVSTVSTVSTTEPPEPLLPEPETPESRAAAAELIRHTTQAMLNAILPPRRFEVNDDQLWEQQVSSCPPTRLDLVNLQEALDSKLEESEEVSDSFRLAELPARWDFYSECFDELIRQVALDSPKRGQLLARVREEIRLSIEYYEILSKTGEEFGVRKALQAEDDDTSSLEKKIAEMEKQKEELKRQMEEKETNFVATTLSEKMQHDIDYKSYLVEKDFLKKVNSQRRNQLERVRQLREAQLETANQQRKAQLEMANQHHEAQQDDGDQAEAANEQGDETPETTKEQGEGDKVESDETKPESVPAG